MPLLVLLFIVVPIIELYVIIEVGQWIGVIPTLAILVGDALLGSLLLRQQGRTAWRRFNQALDQRRFPGRETADGVMIIVGGTLLLTPGFVTDIAGLLLLIPPTRAVIRRGLWGVLGRRFKLVGGGARWGYERMRGRARGPGGAPEPGPGAGRPHDVEGTAHEVPGAGERRPGPEGTDGRDLPPPRRP